MRKIALLFEMSENERRGFLVLSIVIGLIGLTPFVYRAFSTGSTEEIQMLSSIVEERGTSRAYTTESRRPHTFSEKPSDKKKKNIVPFAFDPNKLPVEKWKLLGFTERQIQVIKNYESKGGQFRTKADVAKMYVISDGDFERLEPYIDLPDNLPRTDGVKRPHPSQKSVSADNMAKSIKRKIAINLSTADTAALKEVHGIGSVLASRIVRFRDALGGFHTIEQLKEVYGLSEEQFEKMESALSLGDTPVKKWDVNDLSVEQLAQHPYISRKEATHIVRYREQHGAFNSLADLEKVYALNSDFLRKIAPYFGFRDQ